MDSPLLLLSQEQAHLQSWTQTPNRKTIFGEKKYLSGREERKIICVWHATGRRMNALRVVQSLNEF